MSEANLSKSPHRGWKKCPKCGDDSMTPATGDAWRFRSPVCEIAKKNGMWPKIDGCVRWCSKCGHVEPADKIDDEWFKHWFHGSGSGGGFGNCGCGRPEDGVEFLKTLLRSVKNWKLDGFHTGAQQILWGMLDDHGLTEHGGCLPGWLNKAGEAVLAYLEAMPEGANPLHDDALDDCEP